MIARQKPLYIFIQFTSQIYSSFNGFNGSNVAIREESMFVSQSEI